MEKLYRTVPDELWGRNIDSLFGLREKWVKRKKRGDKRAIFTYKIDSKSGKYTVVNLGEHHSLSSKQTLSVSRVEDWTLVSNQLRPKLLGEYGGFSVNASCARGLSRIVKYGNTLDRKFDFKTEEEAKIAMGKEVEKKNLFTSFSNLAEREGGENIFNHVMTRIAIPAQNAPLPLPQDFTVFYTKSEVDINRWFFATQNIVSKKLTAQIRALDLSKAIKFKTGKDVVVPIVEYTDGKEGQTTEYTETQQNNDLSDNINYETSAIERYCPINTDAIARQKRLIILMKDNFNDLKDTDISSEMIGLINGLSIATIKELLKRLSVLMEGFNDLKDTDISSEMIELIDGLSIATQKLADISEEMIELVKKLPEATKEAFYAKVKGSFKSIQLEDISEKTIGWVNKLPEATKKELYAEVKDRFTSIQLEDISKKTIGWVNKLPEATKKDFYTAVLKADKGMLFNNMVSRLVEVADLKAPGSKRVSFKALFKLGIDVSKIREIQKEYIKLKKKYTGNKQTDREAGTELLVAMRKAIQSKTPEEKEKIKKHLRGKSWNLMARNIIHNTFTAKQLLGEGEAGIDSSSKKFRRGQ